MDGTPYYSMVFDLIYIFDKFASNHSSVSIDFFLPSLFHLKTLVDDAKAGIAKSVISE